MKTRKRILSIVLTIATLLLLVLDIPVTAAGTKKVDVLFTHDTHSHLDSFSTIVDGQQKEVGGFAKIKTLMDEKKKDNPDTLVLDGGDFSMGTLIQTVYDTEAAELRMLGYLGYDVTTFGNHEYDYRSKGLANMLKAAINSGETVPEIAVCNVDWDAMEKDGLNDGQKQIKEAFEAYGVKDYVVVQKGDTRIAVVGVFGKDALECAPTCELLFKDPVEAVKQSLLKLSNEEVAIRIIHGGVGAINESDVSLAIASSAIIIGFNVRPDNMAKSTADREKVDLRLYKVIYDAINDIESAMKGMLDPIYEEKVIGHAEVRQTFKASGLGTIAGSYVLDGKIERNCKARISRGDEQIFEGSLASLKRFKDDVKEVAAGYECGLVFEGFNDIQVEDRVELYVMVEVPR